MGEKGEGIKKYKLVVTEQSQGYKSKHRDCFDGCQLGGWVKKVKGLTGTNW